MLRSTIITTLSNKLQDNISVFAFWLEWADAHERVDQYSDIDMWIDVEDGYESKAFEELENMLKEFWQIDFAHEVKHPHPKIRQKFFHIKDTSEFLIIDVCAQSHSRIFWYTKENKDEKVKILFDKTGVVNYKELDKTRFDTEIQERMQELKKTFLFFQVWVKKSIQRNNFLGALGYYHDKVLKPLVELLRLKHEPSKKDFYLKDIVADLPLEQLKELEDLYKITSIEDIKMNMEKANRMFSNFDRYEPQLSWKWAKRHLL